MPEITFRCWLQGGDGPHTTENSADAVLALDRTLAATRFVERHWKRHAYREGFLVHVRCPNGELATCRVEVLSPSFVVTRSMP